MKILLNPLNTEQENIVLVDLSFFCFGVFVFLDCLFFGLYELSKRVACFF